jgi:hypothetical protein
MPEYDSVSRLPSVVVVSYEASSKKERVGFLDRHGELTFMEVWGNPISGWLSAHNVQR